MLAHFKPVYMFSKQFIFDNKVLGQPWRNFSSLKLYKIILLSNSTPTPRNKMSRKHTSPEFFNPVSNSQITTNKIFQLPQIKISYSSVVPLVLPWVAACDCKFYALPVYLLPAFTILLQLEAYLEPSRTSAMEPFWKKSQRLKVAKYFC